MSATRFTQSPNKEMTQSPNKQRGTIGVVTNEENQTFVAWEDDLTFATVDNPHPIPSQIDPEPFLTIVQNENFASIFPVTSPLPTTFLSSRAYYYPSPGSKPNDITTWQSAPLGFDLGGNLPGDPGYFPNPGNSPVTSIAFPHACLPNYQVITGRNGYYDQYLQFSCWLWSSNVTSASTESKLVARRSRWRVNFSTTAWIATADIWVMPINLANPGQAPYPPVYGWGVIPSNPNSGFNNGVAWGAGLRNFKLVSRDIAIVAQQFYEVPLPTTRTYTSPLTAGFVGSICFMVHTVSPEEWQAQTGFVLQTN